MIDSLFWKYQTWKGARRASQPEKRTKLRQTKRARRVIANSCPFSLKASLSMPPNDLQRPPIVNLNQIDYIYS